MQSIRRSEERGHAEHGWLSSRHTFSFAGYYDPRFTGYRELLVINEDRVAPGQGFGTHGHRNMEILSYVLEGALEHADSIGNGSVIRPGDVQIMSAGTGVRHSEYNHSRSAPVHFLQIWIRPDTAELEPRYEQKTITLEDKKNQFRTIASKNGRDGSVTIHQDANIYAALVEPQKRIEFSIPENRYIWLHVATGEIKANGHELRAGDALALNEEPELVIEGHTQGEALLFDLA